MDPITTTIPVIYLRGVTTRLDALVIKAAKYGCDPITYTVGEEKLVTTNIDGHSVRIKAVDITITGDAPRIGNYTFVAKIDVIEGGAKIINEVPGKSVDIAYRTSGNGCDHCNQSRNRKHLYIVEDVNTGTQMQIGKSCVGDYLGRDTPAKAITFFNNLEGLKSLDDDFGLSMLSGTSVYSIEKIIELSVLFSKSNGYMSRVKADEMGTLSTSDEVGTALVKGDYDPSLITSEITDKAKAIIDWVANGMDDTSTYSYNLKAIVTSEDVLYSLKHVGLVASAVLAYDRYLSDLQKANSQGSEYVGKVGERLKKIDAKVNAIVDCGEGAYGPIVLIKFLAGDNVLAWFTNGSKGLSVGDDVSLSGTVKKHDEYKGIKQTVLTRCRV